MNGWVAGAAPDVPEHENTKGGSEWNRENAASDSAEKSGSDHHRDDDRQRMQANAIAHDFRGNNESFEKLNDREDANDDQRMEPVAELNCRENYSRHNAYSYTEEWHDA